jgi:hypothetical protein
LSRACSTNERETKVTYDIGGKARRKRPLGRPRRRWVYNIKMDHRDRIE